MGFHNVISSATRITISASKAINPFITNISTNVVDAGAISCDISDHVQIFFLVCIHEFLNNHTKNAVTFRQMSDKCLFFFRNKILNFDWMPVVSELGVNNEKIKF